VTLIGRAVVDEKLMPFGLSNLRRSSLPKLVSLDPVSYSLSESLLEESYEHFLCFFPLAAFFWPLAFLNGLKHGCHIRQPFLTPMLIVGLMLVKRLTSGCTEGLAILIIKAEKARIVGLVGAPWQNLLVHPF
jgi:hypothetical protein